MFSFPKHDCVTCGHQKLRSKMPLLSLLLEMVVGEVACSVL